MKIQVDRNISELYLGKWFFSYYLDYRLTITSQKNIMQIKLYDILRKENCSLKLISISEFYLSLWMESSWGAYKIKIYPQKNGKIGVEFFDNDIYKKCRKKPTIEEKTDPMVLVDDFHLQNYYGLWATADKCEYIRIEPLQNGTSISLYSDISDTWDSIKLIPYSIQFIYEVTDESIYFTISGAENKNTQDMQISFHKNFIVLSHSRMLSTYESKSLLDKGH